MNETLQVLILKLARSKKTWQEKAKYLFYGLIFYPLLKKEEIRQLKGEKTSDTSTVGDDVYPLF
ncbi:hypothetical protein [Kiloniella laminariae]|uniref:hypothetical protein n=1 Tax=Kiloniella laminariae TaxID=454162 RepID=UPI0003753E7B|nr:hypothetical protein [Kiloniella laminariae]